MMLLTCRFLFNFLSIVEIILCNILSWILHWSEKEHLISFWLFWAGFAAVDTNQGVEKSLDQNCVAKTDPSKVGFVSCFDFVFPSTGKILIGIWDFLISILQCIFPQEFLKNIRTPVFLVNPAYDYWQVRVTNPSMRTFRMFPFDFTPIHVYYFTNTNHKFRLNMSWYQLLLIQIKVGLSADSILRNVMLHRWEFYMVIIIYP